ncbi:MAG: ribose 5-phosphate isomerase B [Acidobacteria bacterium]|nr:ribose 5-phosphate isomerase B [Acidobacteriota bacterium]
MRIAIGSDHGGYPLNEAVIELLESLGHTVIDHGVHSPAAADYPDAARAVAESVQRGEADRGVVLCGSGVGVTITANKFRGIRACLCHDTYSAHQGVEHDAMNVLCLGARIVGVELALACVRSFLSAEFTNEERHLRRSNKVEAIEREQAASA